MTSNPSPDEPRWFARMRELYARADAEIDPHQHLCKLRGVCCDFRRAEHVLYALEIEARYAIEWRRRTGAPIPAAESPELCRFWRGGLCHARAERPLGCRTYFCDPSWKEQGEALHERYHREIALISAEEGVPYDYRPWVERLGPESAREA